MDSEKEQKELRKKELDIKIANEEAKITLLDQLQLDFEAIKKSVTRCVDLLSNAVQSDNTKILYEDLHTLNNKLYKDSKKLFENDITSIRTEVLKYTEEKNKLTDEKKN